jgi:hypothetical protein
MTDSPNGFDVLAWARGLAKAAEANGAFIELPKTFMQGFAPLRWARAEEEINLNSEGGFKLRQWRLQMRIRNALFKVRRRGPHATLTRPIKSFLD